MTVVAIVVPVWIVVMLCIAAIPGRWRAARRRAERPRVRGWEQRPECAHEHHHEEAAV